MKQNHLPPTRLGHISSKSHPALRHQTAARVIARDRYCDSSRSGSKSAALRQAGLAFGLASVAALAASLWALPAKSEVTVFAPATQESWHFESSAGAMVMQKAVAGLESPWSFAFLPKKQMLITERSGKLVLVADGKAHEVKGLPQVRDLGQGGLLDVLVPEDFAQSREIWLSFSGETPEGLATMAGRGVLSADGTSLEGFKTVYKADPAPASRHFGARLVEAADGTIFLTTGDRGTGPGGLQAQDPKSSIGAVIQLHRDGAAASAGNDFAPGVYSIGHRNMQGAAILPNGGLLVSEHGARGGDEINLVVQGRNYGWPLISYGVNYDGTKIGSGVKAPGLEQPMHYWDPSIAPSGMMVYSGKLIPDWQGDVFSGSLKLDFISRLDPDKPAATGWSEERIATEETLRVRDIREAPDGAIWFLSETNGALYHIRPEAKK